MTGKVTNFYAGGNTARGFANFFDSSLQNLDRLFILKGGPGTGKSTLIRTIGEDAASRGFDIWFIHCASDNGSLDGVVIPSLKVGIVDGTAPHVIEPRVPGAVEEYVNLGEAWNSVQLAGQRAEIESLNKQIKQGYTLAYTGFADALRIHDEWETVYIKNMDFQAAEEVTQEYTERLFGGKQLNKTSRVDHRFLGAATPAGAFDFVPNLTEGLSKRYFIKGRPGTGKSTMLKKLAAAAEHRGFDVEIYHCGFDPNSLDMIIVRELGIAMFDSTAPHEYFPELPTDEIVDMYERCVAPGTDEAYGAKLADVSKRYSQKMKESIGHLAHVKDLHDELERIYVQAMDFDVVNRITASICEEIEGMMDNCN